MFKKLVAMLVIFTMVFSLVACGNKPQDSGDAGAGDEGEVATGGETGEETGGNYKIGIMTGTVSQGEEEFRAAEKMIETYGDMIKHVTYPDKFSQEVETTISNIKSLAADPDVKAIVIVQAVPGTAAAIDAVREMREDILFMVGAPHEDPDVIAERADIALELDQLQRGKNIMQVAEEMGAETFVHYSFPRHMSYELLSARRDELKKKAEELGIKFVEIDAPDPTGDAGLTGAQQFIHEDVPRVVEQYGKNTAFFNTNCGMQEPLIKQVLETGAIYPEQCCPSPYHAYPGALGIEIPQDKAGDLDYLSEQIRAKIAEKGGSGRFGTWKTSANVAMIEAGVRYAIEYLDGEIERLDQDAMLRLMREITKEDELTLKPLSEDSPNFLLFVISSQVF